MRSGLLPSGSHPPSKNAFFYAITFLAAIIGFLDLAVIGSSTEARETHVADLMLTAGNWVLPERLGILPSKPPLFHWIAALLGFSLGTVTPFVARLVSALAAAGVVFIVYDLSWRWSAVRELGERQLISLLSVFVLTTSYGFLHLAGDARVDMLFTFFCTSAIYFLTRHVLVEEHNAEAAGENNIISSDFSLFFVSAGAAVLTKGPLGLVLPVLISGSIIAACTSPKAAFQSFLRPRLGWLFFALVCLPWYFAAVYRAEGEFIARQLLFENALRAVGGEHVNSNPIWFYFTSFVSFLLPWGPLAIYFAVRGASRLRVPARLGLLWFLAGFILFSLASGKRHAYLLPLIPGMAMFVAFSCVDYLPSLKRAAGRFPRISLSLSFSLLLLIGSLWLCTIESVRAYATMRLPLTTNILPTLDAVANRNELLLGLALLMLVFVWRRIDSSLSRVTLLWLMVVLLFQSTITAGYAIKYRLKNFDQTALGIQTILAPNQKVILIREVRDEYLDPLMYYLKQPAEILSPDAKLPTGRPIVAEYAWLLRRYPDRQKMRNEIKIIASFDQLHDKLMKRLDRSIVLFEVI